MAMLLTHTRLTPSEMGQISYYGIINLLQYITRTGPYVKRQRNVLEEQLTPEEMKRMFSR